jgi:peptidoglycan LD-endopeptidase CwlK
MSAGASVESMVVRSLDGCAPQFAQAVLDALADCDEQGFDAYVYESLRSEELQALYYARGRAKDENGDWYIVNRNAVVTNARSALFSWHIYGVAVDVISLAHEWDVSTEWRRGVTEIFKAHGLAAGADWPHPDLPHYQFAKCKRSPSDRARELYATGGLPLVWQVVGAA